jgi:hypothetical protein
MDPGELRAFARRNRSAIEQSKGEQWASEFRQHGGLFTMQGCHAMWEYARSLRPDIPTPGDGAEDLAGCSLEGTEIREYRRRARAGRARGGQFGRAGGHASKAGRASLHPQQKRRRRPTRR